MASPRSTRAKWVPELSSPFSTSDSVFGERRNGNTQLALTRYWGRAIGAELACKKNLRYNCVIGNDKEFSRRRDMRTVECYESSHC